MYVYEFLFCLLQVREPAEAKAGKSFSKFEAKSFATQVVNGVNYFVKVMDTSFVNIVIISKKSHP